MNLFWQATALRPDNSAEFTATVVIAGLGIVLATLMLLIVIFYFFGKIVSSVQQNANKRTNQKKNSKKAAQDDYPDISKMKTETPLPPVPLTEESISGEVIAAISAAVYMLEGEKAVVTSVTRKRTAAPSRSVWAQAAVIENTRPF